MNKFNVLLIGTIAIGIFLLPNVISTFTGSHNYIAPENVNCTKCHMDVYEELHNSIDDHTHANSQWSKWYTHQQGLLPIRKVFDCVECHSVSEVGRIPGEGHAAKKVDCAFCHNKTRYEAETGKLYTTLGHAPNAWYMTSGLCPEYGMACTDCHRPTGNYPENLFIDDVFDDEITNISAPHHQFYENAKNDSILLGGSESCVACHSHTKFTITAPLGKNITYSPNSGLFGRE